MNYKEWCELKSNDAYKENMFPKPTDAQEAINILKDYFLGEDWYVNYSGCADQTNTEIVAEIMLNYPSLKYKQYSWYKKLWLYIKSFLFNIPIYKYH